MLWRVRPGHWYNRLSLWREHGIRCCHVCHLGLTFLQVTWAPGSNSKMWGRKHSKSFVLFTSCCLFIRGHDLFWTETLYIVSQVSSPSLPYRTQEEQQLGWKNGRYPEHKSCGAKAFLIYVSIFMLFILICFIHVSFSVFGSRFSSLSMKELCCISVWVWRSCH